MIGEGSLQQRGRRLGRCARALGLVTVGLGLLVSWAPVGATAADERARQAAASPFPCLCERWVSYYEQFDQGSQHRATDVVVSPDGRLVFVTGWSLGTGFDFATVAYDAADGRQVWVARYDGTQSDDMADAIAVSPDGSTVYVTGRSQGPAEDMDYATVAYATSDGERLWVARYDGPNGGSDLSNGVEVSPDSETVFVTGFAQGPGGQEFATVAYDAATGREIWVASYAGPLGGGSSATGLAVSPDGRFIAVTGSSTGDGTSLDYATVAYDAAVGTVLWAARFNGPGGFVDQPFGGVTISPDGGQVFVAGYSRTDSASATRDYATVAYDAADGHERWVARYDGPANGSDSPVGVRVSPDGQRVFVTGTSAGLATGDDYATVAYDAAGGQQRWVARYDWLFTEDARSVEVSPDGTQVYVTGMSQKLWIGQGTGAGYSPWRDMVTVAYDPADGTEIWAARYDEGAVGVGGGVLAVSPDSSNLFVTGGIRPADTGPLENRTAYATLSYDRDGPGF